MNNQEIENILNAKQVKPTSNRILVLRELIKASHPVSLADLEVLLEFWTRRVFSERSHYFRKKMSSTLLKTAVVR